MSVLAKDFLTQEESAGAEHSLWIAERSALVADVLRGHSGPAQSIRLQVRGESMLPAIWPGDIVEISPCLLEDLTPGEIVLALRDGNLFLHRFIGPRGADAFSLRGDSMPGPDPPFPADAILGRLVRSSDESFFAPFVRLSRALGLLLCHCAPARRVALQIHRRLNVSAGAAKNPAAAAELEML